MPNDGKIPSVQVVNPKPDHDQIVKLTDLHDDNDPLAEGGGDSADDDPDKWLKETGQAPHAPSNEVITEPVDHPILHANKNALEKDMLNPQSDEE